MKKLLIAVVASMVLSGCAQQTFTINKDIAEKPQQTTTHHFFVGGIGQAKTIDAAAVCGGADKVVRTEVQQTFLDGFLGYITFAIYTPRDARVYCSK